MALLHERVAELWKRTVAHTLKLERKKETHKKVIPEIQDTIELCGPPFACQAAHDRSQAIDGNSHYR